jgi:hypothetical protein
MESIWDTPQINYGSYNLVKTYIIFALLISDKADISLPHIYISKVSLNNLTKL